MTDERVLAQKLMVYSCPLVPGMVANRTPQLPGLVVEDATWDETALTPLKGKGKVVK